MGLKLSSDPLALALGRGRSHIEKHPVFVPLCLEPEGFQLPHLFVAWHDDEHDSGLSAVFGPPPDVEDAIDRLPLPRLIVEVRGQIIVVDVFRP